MKKPLLTRLAPWQASHTRCAPDCDFTYSDSAMNYILIVDDQADIRRLLSITLGKHFEVIEAENGTEALFSVRRYHPKVVLLDVMMPGDMDGLQVLDAIKADPASSDTLVGMVTARGQQADSEDARRRGADAYFIKPFSPIQVANWIHEQLQT